MFLPATPKELLALGWDSVDVVLVTGDAYIDSPYIGVAVIGKILLSAGYRVGIIAQPDTSSDSGIRRLGEPRLFWGVSSGCMDSMVANYTATLKKRKSDDLTAGEKNCRRPDRALIAYTNLIRKHFKNTKAIILGGIEASLRRVSHYDYWSDSVRRSVLFDAKADLLVYGMGEKAILEIADHMDHNRPFTGIRGICYIAKEKPTDYIELPSHTDVTEDKSAFRKMFQAFDDHNVPETSIGLCQKQDTRYLIQNPPQYPLSSLELDRIHELSYERAIHPIHLADGNVRALETIQFAITSHRGCFGECRFCAISAHQGRHITSRSEASILREASEMTKHRDFKGIIRDVGGPTANMYGMDCVKSSLHQACRKKCLTPVLCPKRRISHQRLMDLLARLRKLPKIRKVFIGSGIRHDLILMDTKYGRQYLEAIARDHISGQLKIAPEHSEDHILKLMGKPGSQSLKRFIEIYHKINQLLGKKQFLSCYFMAAYPGCTMEDMKHLKTFIRKELKFTPEQTQIFTPTPSTVATLMYYTETDPLGSRLFVEKKSSEKEKQKKAVLRKVLI
jgi:uncharacterized radical SAM protein YgiQ